MVVKEAFGVEVGDTWVCRYRAEWIIDCAGSPEWVCIAFGGWVWDK